MMALTSCLSNAETESRWGKSGLKVSKIILGAMSFGSSQWQDWVLDEEAALPIIEHAYKSGINTWDTVGLQISTTW